MAPDDLDQLDDTALKNEIIRLRAELAKGAETTIALEDAYVELGNVGALLHEIEPAHKLALQELDRLRPICDAQAALIDQQQVYLRDMETLRARNANERRRLEEQTIAAAERFNELQRRHAAMSIAFANMTVQLEALCAERAEIEGYVSRLAGAIANARLRMIDAQRSEHQVLCAFADSSGSVTSIGERIEYVSLIRERLDTLFSQLETMDEHVALLEASRLKSRGWWR